MKMALLARRKCAVDPMATGPSRHVASDARSGLGKIAIGDLRRKVPAAQARMVRHRAVLKVIGRSLPGCSRVPRCAAARTLKC